MKVSIAGSLTQPTDKGEEEEGDGEPEPAKKETAAKRQKVSTTIEPLHEPADFQKFSTTIQSMLEPADLEEEQEVQEAKMPRKLKVSTFALGLAEEDELPPGTEMTQQEFREMSEQLDHRWQQRLAQKQHKMAPARRQLVRQGNCAEEEDLAEPGRSEGAAAGRQQQFRQSSVSVSFSSNVRVERARIGERPRASSDAGLLNNLGRVALQSPTNSNNNKSSGAGRRVQFGNVDVFRFGLAQGANTVPSVGGVSLGMEMRHHSRYSFNLEEFDKYKRAENLLKYTQWHEISQAMLSTMGGGASRKRKLAQMVREDNGGECSTSNAQNRQPSPKRPKYADTAIEPSNSSSSSSSSDESEVGPEEEEQPDGEHQQQQEQLFEQWRVFEPLRRVILVGNDVHIDEDLASETLQVAENRTRCGCQCRGGKCRPSKCECAREGIKCQVDFHDDDDPASSYPCACTAAGCKNPEGRTELDMTRIRNHFLQTQMRMRAARRQSQRVGDGEEERKHSPQHIFFKEPEEDGGGEQQGPSTSGNGQQQVSQAKSPCFSTVTAQLRPELAQVACSTGNFFSPDPFVTIRKKSPRTVVAPALVANFEGTPPTGNGMPSKEGEPAEVASSPFPMFPSLLINGASVQNAIESAAADGEPAGSNPNNDNNDQQQQEPAVVKPKKRGRPRKEGN